MPRAAPAVFPLPYHQSLAKMWHWPKRDSKGQFVKALQSDAD
jgi:hypothetical protein